MENKKDNGRIDKKVYDLLCQRVQAEWESMVFYRQLQGICDANKMPSAGKYMGARADDEIKHAKKFNEYISKRGGVEPQLTPIKAPKLDCCTLQEIVEAAFEYAQKATEELVCIATCAEKAGDIITREFMSWFLKDQVEEESTFDRLLDDIEKANGDEAAIQNIEWGMPYRDEVWNKTSDIN